MKRLFTILFCLCTTYLQAQDPGARPGQSIGGIVVKGGQNPRPKDKFQISAGAGFISPSQAVKNNLNIGNLSNYSLGLYIPVLNYGGATGGVISYGFNVAGSYFNGNRDYNLSNNPSYNIIGQSTTPTITAKGTGSPKQQGFKTEAGVQANFNFGNFSISPLLNAAYINFKQKAFSVTQTSSVNGQTREFNLYSQVESKTSGVAFIPKLQFRYNFGDQGNFGVFIEPNYIIGPTVKNDATTFKPNGVANAQGQYNIDQILFGNNVTATKSTKLNGFGLNAGISFALGKGQKKTIGKQTNPSVNNIKEFSNGCTRTCTGNWTWNQSSNTYSCNGEAGPLVCANGMGNTPLTGKIGQLFNPAGEVVEIAPGSVIGKNAKQLNEEKDNTNPNSDPQSIIYGGNPPPILLCYKLFNLANELVPIDGFVNMYNVYSISLTPCGGNDPNAFVSFPPLGTNVNNQTIEAKLLTKSDKSLAGKGIKFEKDIDISKYIAEKYQVENAIIKAGIYTFNNKNEINLPIVFGQPAQESKGNNFGEKMVGGIHAAGNNAKESNPKVKCNCGTDIYGKDEEACKRICQFLKDGTYSNLGVNPDIKSGENITVKSQILKLPNNMGIGWQPLENIVYNDKDLSKNKITYQDLTADEAKRIDQLQILYLLPSNISIATTNLKNLGEQNTQFDWYWKVYKNNKENFVALPMPLMLSEDGLKNLGGAMRKNNSPSTGPTGQAPCKFIYRSLSIDVSYLHDYPEPYMPDYIDVTCKGGSNLIFAPHADSSATGNLANYPSKMVYNSDGTTIRIISNQVSKVQNLKEANFSSTYIEGYGMVVYPMDYGISNKEASILIDGLFRGSKKAEVFSKSSEGNTIKFFGTQNSAAAKNASGPTDPCDPAIYKNSWIGEVGLTVFPITPTNTHQGGIPVYYNPTNINFQFNGFIGSVDVKIENFNIWGYFSTYNNYNNLFSSPSITTTNHNLNVSNYPPGKYAIMAGWGPDGKVKRNLCMPIFIIAHKLVNKTVLPNCVYPQQTIPITWTGGSGTANVNLVVRRMNTPTAYVPINISIPNTGNYNLIIPNTGFTVGENYSVEINDGNQYASTIYKNDIYTPGNVFKICKKIDKNTITKSAESKLPTGLNLQVDDCKCGSWQSKIIKVDNQVKEIVCNDAINLKLNSNAFFNLKYNGSSSNCTIKYEVIITKPNGSTSTVLITNNTNWNYLFNATGNYSLFFKTYSNDVLCPDGCKYSVIVN